MARTSLGSPDHALFRSSAMFIDEAWRIFLNLFMRVIRAECASTSFADAPAGTGGCDMRCRLLAGSRNMSLYCGRKIFWPSVLRFMVGYAGIARTSDTSPLSSAGAYEDAEVTLPFREAFGYGVLLSLPNPLMTLDSLVFLEDAFLPFLRIDAMLGSPNSSSSSSKPNVSPSSSQALLVSERKL